MKVLWFSNTPAAGGEILQGSGVRGGWLSSLDKKLRGKIQLSVAFHFARFSEPFEYLGVMYYPICHRNWKLKIIKEQIFGTFNDTNDLQDYLDIIKVVKPDVIHIHGTENPFGCIVGKTHIPVVISFQGSCTAISHKFYCGIEKDYASISDWSFSKPRSWIFSKSYNYSFKNNAVKSSLREQRNLKNCENIIGRTDWDKRITRILSPLSSYYHNDEILRDSFYESQWVKHVSKSLIIHSTLGEGLFKGLETICETVNELNKIEITVEWRIAGLAKKCLLDRVVKRKLRNSYPQKGLIFLGTLDEQELLKKILEADIFVMPSHIENSPNSLCEAMILGLPCITTLAGGSSSLLIDKEEGIVIQDGDPWSLAGAILELSQNVELAEDYGKKARQKALSRHNPEKVTSELLSIYDLIIKKPLKKAFR